MKELILTGFLGIEFGASTEVAMERMLNRKDCIYNSELSSDSTLVFERVTFAGRQASMLVLLFSEQGFLQSKVYFSDIKEPKLIQTYQDIKSELSAKYFEPQNDYEIYRDPYEKGDGSTEIAIYGGYVTFSSFWDFPNPQGKEENGISLEITDKMEIKLLYEHGDLMAQRSEIDEAQNNSDY
jgi:hypothetical protein